MKRLRDLISPAYLATQRDLHATPRGYGAKGARWVRVVLGVKDAYQCGSILDYGCGQGSLSRALQLATGHGCREYDPAIPGKDHLPDFADLVVCTDVLEHIEPEHLDAVLEHLRLLARKALFVVVSTRLANKTLSDGRNAHLTVQPDAWWRARVEAAGFTVQQTPPIHEVIKPSKAWIAVLTP